MMGSVTRVCWLTSLTVNPARRRAAASVAPILTRASSPGADPCWGSVPGPASGQAPLSGRKRRPFGTRLRALAAQGGTLGAFRRAEDADGEQAGVAGAADRDGRDRDAGRHLDDREQRVEAAQ